MKSGRSKLGKWDDLRMKVFSNPTRNEIKIAAKALKDGNLVAFPTETVYGLGADAENEKAVSRIYSVKGRPIDHPLIVHISNANQLGKWATNVPDYANKLAREFWPGPMTLILKRSKLAKDYVTGGQQNVGIRVPQHLQALTLIQEFEKLGGSGVVAPSANKFGAVSPTSANAVTEELGGSLGLGDVVLDGGNSEVGVESTIIACIENSPVILRPGFISTEMVESVTGLLVKSNLLIQNLKVPGALQSHYSPLAEVVLDTVAQPGDGFFALLNIETPTGSIRLGSPENITEFARDLYSALRLADKQCLQRIVVIQPHGSGLAVAVRDRLGKAASLR